MDHNFLFELFKKPYKNSQYQIPLWHNNALM